MEIKRLQEGRILVTGTRGVMRIAFSNTGAMRCHCSGIQEAEMAPLVISLGEESLAKYGRCVFMVDSLDSPRMDTGFREKMTSWIIKNRQQVKAHVLQQSKFIEMALSVANLVAGNPIAYAYTSIAAWEAVGRREFGQGFVRDLRTAEWLDSKPEA